MISVGEEVEARLPGTRSYNEGKVVAVANNFYTIKFRGGAKHDVVHSNVRFKRGAPETFHRYRSRSRSRGRLDDSVPLISETDRRSAPRRRVTRVTHDDCEDSLENFRMTPTVMLQNILQVVDDVKDMRPERENIMDDSDNSTVISSDLPLFVPEDNRSSVNEYSDENNPEFVSETESNASTRISMTVSKNRIVFGGSRHTPDFLKSRTETGVDQPLIPEATETTQSLKPGRSGQLTNEFGGCIGIILLMISVPSIVLYLNVICSSVSCDLQKPNLSELPKLNAFITYEAIAIFVALSLLISIVSSIPWFGYKMKWICDKNTVLKYNSNGFFCLWLTIFVVGIAIYKSIPVLSMIQNNYIQLLVICLIRAFVSSLLFYLTSGHERSADQINPYGQSRNFIKDFWFGRQLNPRLFDIVDVKLIQFRISYILLFMFQLVYIYKDLNYTMPESLSVADVKAAVYSMDYNATLVSFAALNILFVVDLLYFEYQLPTTFEVQQEGMGFMLAIKYATLPFLKTLPLKYIFEHAVVAPSWAVLLTVNIYIIGYLLYRFSNLMKNLFRSHPLDAHFIYSDSLHTLLGKRLLVTHTWGFVRHPNYLGHIIMIIALAIPLLWGSSWIPLIPTFVELVYMIHRAVRDNERCKIKYGASWERYCYRVKYILFPKLF